MGGRAGGDKLGKLAQAQTDRGEPGRRSVHSIRFSDDEWAAVAKAAGQRGQQPAEFVRETSVDTAKSPTL